MGGIRFYVNNGCLPSRKAAMSNVARVAAVFYNPGFNENAGETKYIGGVFLCTSW